MSERIVPGKGEQNVLKEKLLALCPEIFQDGKLNVEALQTLLPDELEDEEQQREHFGLNWPGKTRARQLALQKPVGSTLKPCPGEGVNEEATQNVFIEGDNLEVLKLLHEAYSDQVKLLYIDPPYNTGSDFVYKDNFDDSVEDYLTKTQQKQGSTLLVANPKAGGRFHSNWLNFIYPRLRIARDLLAETGALFVSIDDNEVHNLRQVLNEVFGEENFVAQLVWQRSKKGDAKLIAVVHEYVLVYCKNKALAIEGGNWRRKKAGVDEVLAQYQLFRQEFKNEHKLIGQAMAKWYRELKEGDPRKAHKHYSNSDANGLYFADNFAGPDDGRASRPRYDILHPTTGKPTKKPSTGWRWEEERTKAALLADPPLIHFGPDETTIPCRKSYLHEIDSEPFSSVFYRDGRAATLQVESLVGKGVFDFPKNTDVIREFLEIIQDKKALVMDFFAGSGTTGHAVLEQNREDGGGRRFVLVQLDERTKEGGAAAKQGYANVAQITRTRLRQVLRGHENAGFRVFKEAKSNFTTHQSYTGTDVGQLTLGFQQATDKPLVEGWTKADLTTEIMLLEGFPLHSRQEPQAQLTENEVVAITSDFNANTLYVCLDAQMQDDTVEALALGREDVLVCLDAALTDLQKVRLDDKLTLKTV